MKAVKIGIVEDERITAKDLSMMLRECGYIVGRPAMRYDEAMAMIELEKPDLLLLDINIPGKLDGIDLARAVSATSGIPVIFLTANSDRATLERVGSLRPAAYLTKPVTKAQLYAAVELAVKTAATLPACPTELPAAIGSLFVNDGRAYHKIEQSDILYAESEENYVRLHIAEGRSVMARTTFTQLIAMLGAQQFIRTHRCYLVAIDKISRVLSDEVVVAGKPIPVSKSYKSGLREALGIR